jgi:hypothetical protein
MSKYFSKVIKAGERQREFNFRKLVSGNEFSYHVDVPDDKGNRIIFQMSKNEDGIWVASTPSLPVWIHDAGEVLNETIAAEQVKEVPRKK